MNNNNLDLNNIIRENSNNKKNKNNAAKQQARKNTETMSREVERNRVRKALENLATKSNNNSHDITKTQVVKYHKIALDDLLRTDILEKALKIDRNKEYALKYEYTRTPHGLQRANTYKLSNFVNYKNFTVYYVTYINQRTYIVIRLYFPQYWLEWFYSPSTELEYAMTFITQLPKGEQQFDIHEVSFSQNEADHNISAKVIDMLTSKLDVQTLRKAMTRAKFPPRLWQMNDLKRKAENNAGKIINIGSNFSNSKLSRIEYFLSNVDDLFSVVASGRENLTKTEIIKRIDAYALKPHMFALQAQRKIVNDIRQPLQRREANRQILLSKANYNKMDKQILSFSVDVLGIVEKLEGTKVGIRELRNKNFGVVIDLGIAEAIVERKAFDPVPFTPGDLYEAVQRLVFFCLWDARDDYANQKAMRSSVSFFWYNTFNKLQTLPDSRDTNKHTIAKYKLFTSKKLKYLEKQLGYLKNNLRTLLREFCETHKNRAYKLVLGLDIL